MNANLAVIADNLDYLLWGRLAEGQPGGVALTLLMAIGATLLALPGGIALAGLAWRYGGLVRRLLFLWAEIIWCCSRRRCATFSRRWWGSLSAC